MILASFVVDALPAARTFRRHAIMTFMDTAWLLRFEQEREEGDDTELLIGVYRTEEDAMAAAKRLKDQPGFETARKVSKPTSTCWGKDSWPKVLFASER